MLGAQEILGDSGFRPGAVVDCGGWLELDRSARQIVMHDSPLFMSSLSRRQLARRRPRRFASSTARLALLLAFACAVVVVLVHGGA